MSQLGKNPQQTDLTFLKINNQGSSLIMVICIAIVMSISAFGFLTTVTSNLFFRDNIAKTREIILVGEVGLNLMARWVRDRYPLHGWPKPQGSSFNSILGGPWIKINNYDMCIKWRREGADSLDDVELLAEIYYESDTTHSNIIGRFTWKAQHLGNNGVEYNIRLFDWKQIKLEP